MKKTLCCLLALLMLFSSAMADTLITGEVVEIPNPGDVRVLLGAEAFEALFNGNALYGSRQADGAMLIGTRDTALRIGALPDAALLKEFADRLDQQPAYESSVYSSLFTSAQQIKLTASEVGRLLLTVLSACPLLDTDGSLRQAAEAAQGDEIWATVIRYTAADQSQYPDALTVLVEKDGPACHLGTDSCFNDPVYISEDRNDFSYDGLMELIRGRKTEKKEGSYTTYLFEKGLDKILKKVGEESTEVIIAAKDRDREETIYEIADLAYHVMVLMVEAGISLEEIRDELARRHVIDHKVKQEKMRAGE